MCALLPLPRNAAMTEMHRPTRASSLHTLSMRRAYPAPICEPAARSTSPFGAAVIVCAVVLLLLQRADAQCAANAYSYGSATCATCAPGATFVSASGGCAPAAAPVGTAFYLSGAQAEDVAAFSTVNVPSGIAYSTNPFSSANSALSLANGSYFSAAGTSAPAALPAGGNVAWSASAWVKCAAPATWATALAWGVADDTRGALTPQVVSLAIVSTSQPAVVGVVSTFAGSARQGGLADGQGTQARFGTPCGLAMDALGNLFVADSSHIIRQVSPSGYVSVFAGSGAAGSGNGIGAAASFYSPMAVALDATGSNLFIADTYNHLIRKAVVSTGLVTTIAGTAHNVGCGDGPAAAALFNKPQGLAVDASGNLFIADTDNHAIRRLTPDGIVSTFAGTCGTLGSRAGPGTAARFYYPFGLAFDPSGSLLYVADNYNIIKKVNRNGLVSTFVGILMKSGVVDGTGTASSFSTPKSIAVDSMGTLYVIDQYSHDVRRVTSSGVVSLLAGTVFDYGFDDGGAVGGIPASFYVPNGITIDPSGGTLYVADSGNCIIRKVSLFTALPACDNTWHHVALIYSPSSASAITTYVDGSLVAQLPASITLPSRSASTLRVGWSGDLTTNGGSLFSGSLSDLRIYARALTAPEVVALSQPQAASFPGARLAPLVAPSAGATAYLFSCAAGSFGPPSSIARSAADGGWSFSSPSPSCTLCPAGTAAQQGASACAPCGPGTYSLAGSATCTFCPAGTFGSSAGLATAACSGACAGCAAGSTTSATSSLSCAASGARTVPSALNFRVWPAAHPANTQRVDLAIAPAAACAAQVGSSCAGRASIVIGDTTYFVVGTAADLHVESGEALACSAA